MHRSPLVSVVVPVKNGGNQLGLCLKHISLSDYKNIEIIVVDDGSSDNSFEIAAGFTTKVFQTCKHAAQQDGLISDRESIGPAGARNIGVTHCEGDIIFFVDSDVLLNKDAISRAKNFLSTNREYSAVFGSYDNSPAETNLISQFRNLLHHFVHQNSSVNAETFWAGCGAIRKDAFLKVNGFDAQAFPNPSVEDIELGYRLTDADCKIFLDKELRSKHLKKWTLISMVKTDIFSRAIPWLNLLQLRQTVPNDLNLKNTQKISGFLMLCSVIIFGCMIGKYCKIITNILPYGAYNEILILTIIIVTLLLIITAINWRLYCFFADNNGLLFTIKAIPIHYLYFFYSSLTFVFFITKNLLINRKFRNKLN